MKSFLVILFIVAASSCSAQKKLADAGKETASNGVRQALQGQVNAWNKGDLENAMSYYWNDTSMLWISRKGIDKGYAPVYAAYLKDFTDRSKMGTYTYEPLYIEVLSGSSVYYVFKWKIELNGKRMMGGTSSQVWKFINNRWVVTSEHAS
jgi:hypothetical protein